jgi:transcriptional regulator with XRE-family HTH domain/quercetin dioxygenase-like cupin family protein
MTSAKPKRTAPDVSTRVTAAVDGDVPRRLRAERERRHMSVRELARRLQLSPSAISQIERGIARPSVATLYAIVTELGLSLDELFAHRSDSHDQRSSAGSAAVAPPEHNWPVVAQSDRVGIELRTGVRWERLTADPDPEVDFLYVVYEVGGSSSPDDTLMRHPGREYGLVLSGKLEVTVQFDTYVLEAGDSISFDSTIPHRLRNIGDEPMIGVWIVIGRRAPLTVEPNSAQTPVD